MYRYKKKGEKTATRERDKKLRERERERESSVRASRADVIVTLFIRFGELGRFVPLKCHVITVLVLLLEEMTKKKGKNWLISLRKVEVLCES